MAAPPPPSSAPGWVIHPSATASRSSNPIRQIVDRIKKPNLPDKPLIPLSLGDPTIFGNFRAPDVLEMTMHRSLASGKHNGYIHSAGSVEARRAIAKRAAVPGHVLTEDDVVIASGCSGALDLAIAVLLNPGDLLLLPKPAFPLYQTLAESKGVEVAHYRLDPLREWEVDLPHLEHMLATCTRLGERGGHPLPGHAPLPGSRRNVVLLVNNPSNPCGSVYSAAHLSAVLTLAEAYRTPVIADEIYEGLVFPASGATFVPMASLTSTVPILSAGGIAKEFLVPGWRAGWVVVHDRQGLLGDVRKGLLALTQLILGANSLVVSALPAILDPAPNSPEAASLASFKTNTLSQLEHNATYLATRIRAMPGVSVSVPHGAMYVMMGMDPAFFHDGVKDDVDMAQGLLAEENVFLLPGQCFAMPLFARIVFCAPKAKLAEAMDRLEAFLLRHAADPTGAAATLAARKAACASELAALSSPWLPPAPHVGLRWGPVRGPGGAQAIDLASLTPRLTCLADSEITDSPRGIALNGTPAATAGLSHPSPAKAAVRTMGGGGGHGGEGAEAAGLQPLTGLAILAGHAGIRVAGHATLAAEAQD